MDLPVLVRALAAPQCKAILEYLAVPTVAGTDPDASSDKYAVLKHDVESSRPLEFRGDSGSRGLGG